MEIHDNVNLFPTEVQEVMVSQQNKLDQENKVQQSNEIQNIDVTSNIQNEEMQSKEKLPLDSVINEGKTLTSNFNSENLLDNNKEIEKNESINKTKRIPRTCPQTAQMPPIFGKRTIKIIAKPKTTATKSSLSTTKKCRISSLLAEKSLPKNLMNNPIIAKKYGIYTPDVIISRPPRAALDSSEYKPKLPVELGDLAQSILNGEHPNKEATKEELKEAKVQLKNLELELIDKSDYMAAKKAAAAFDYMENYVNHYQDVAKLKESLESIISKRNELIAYITSIQESIQNQLQEQKAIADDRLKELENQQTIEIQEFDENVPTELTKEFRHQSKDYLELRVKQRSLAMKREFDEAQKLKEKADKIEESQIKGDIIKMKKFYKRKRKHLLRKHRVQIQCLMDDNLMRTKEIINSRQFEIDSTKARIASLDDELKRKCEEKGVDINELDDRKIDQQRVDHLISRSNETRYAKFRPRLLNTFSTPSSQYASLRQPLPPLSDDV